MPNIQMCVHELHIFNVLCAFGTDGTLFLCDLNLNPKTKSVKSKIGILGGT